MRATYAQSEGPAGAGCYPGWRRLRGLAGLSVLLALLAAVGLSAGRVPAVQAQSSGGAGFAVRYQGWLSFGNTPAPAGTQITAITARSVTDVTTCAQGSVSDNQGDFSIDVPALPLCTQGPQNPHLQGVVFVADHQNVGGAPDLADITEPATLGRVVSNLHLEGTAMPGPLPATDFGALGMPAVWYTGQLTLAGTAAPQGTSITLQALVNGNTTASCGQGTVVDGQGDFIASVPATSGCVSQTNGANVAGYIFYVNGENVGGAPSGDTFLDQPYTLGQVLPNVTLSGQQAALQPCGSSLEDRAAVPLEDGPSYGLSQRQCTPIFNPESPNQTGSPNLKGTLTDTDARQQMDAYNISITSSGDCSDPTDPSCTSLQGIRLGTVYLAEALSAACDCHLTITGGTETGHSTNGTYTHGNGYKLDLSATSDLTDYIENNYTYTGQRGGVHGGPQYVDSNGDVFTLESGFNHWDIQWNPNGTSQPYPPPPPTPRSSSP